MPRPTREFGPNNAYDRWARLNAEMFLGLGLTPAEVASDFEGRATERLAIGSVDSKRVAGAYCREAYRLRRDGRP